MVIFPNCKINIGLHIISKREDGYHNLQTIFYPIAVHDALEIVEHNDSGESVSISSSGIDAGDLLKNNICTKAYQLLKKDFPQLPSVKIHLHKNIPMGAGLGGGSSDGAFALQLLNNKYDLQLSSVALMAYALELGSDCPFFLLNQPAYAENRGETLEPIALDLSSYRILIINPGIHVNTRWAFSQIHPAANRADLRKMISQPISTWRESVQNDFEQPVFAHWPEIASIKAELYKKGALYASMSGSGSSVFGIFDRQAAFPHNFPAGYICKWA